MTVDQYIEGMSPTQKTEFEKIRTLVQAVAPGAVEALSYGVIGFKYNGKVLIWFGAFKDHMSLFPGAPEELKEKLGKHITGKGTIQFSETDPLPESIIKQILQSRLAVITGQK